MNTIDPTFAHLLDARPPDPGLAKAVEVIAEAVTRAAAGAIDQAAAIRHGVIQGVTAAACHLRADQTERDAAIMAIVRDRLPDTPDRALLLRLMAEARDLVDGRSL